MEKRNIYLGVALMVSLVLIIVIAFNSLITGNLINSRTPYNTIGGCTDSDGGDVPLVAGVVTQTMSSGIVEFSDACLSPNTLNEVFCVDAAAASKAYNCNDLKENPDDEHLVCLNSRCIPISDALEEPGFVDGCFESDGGLNPDVKGTLRSLKFNVEEEDFCSQPRQLEEYYCTHGGYGRTTINCFCVNGRCTGEIPIEPKSIDDLLLEKEDDRYDSDYDSGSSIGDFFEGFFK